MGLVLEVILEEAQVVHVHGQSVLVDQRSKRILIKRSKAGEGGNLGGDGIGLLQALGFIQAGFPALYGVDDIFLDALKLLGGDGAIEGIDLGGGYQRTLAAGQDSDALGAGIGPLIVLTRERLHGKYGAVTQLRHGFVIAVVHHGLGEDRLAGFGVDFRA